MRELEHACAHIKPWPVDRQGFIYKILFGGREKIRITQPEDHDEGEGVRGFWLIFRHAYISHEWNPLQGYIVITAMWSEHALTPLENMIICSFSNHS